MPQPLLPIGFSAAAVREIARHRVPANELWSLERRCRGPAREVIRLLLLACAFLAPGGTLEWVAHAARRRTLRRRPRGDGTRGPRTSSATGSPTSCLAVCCESASLLSFVILLVTATVACAAFGSVLGIALHAVFAGGGSMPVAAAVTIQCNVQPIAHEYGGERGEVIRNMARFYLNTASLSLAPGEGEGNAGLVGVGKDPLDRWPHEYDSAAENRAWSQCLNWSAFGNVVQECATELFTFNYAFNALFDYIPSGYNQRDKVVLFDVQRSGQYSSAQAGYEAKMKNWFAAFAYIAQYPKQMNSRLQNVCKVSLGTFSQQVIPTIFSIAENMSFLDWNLRLWEYNHTEMYPERITFVVDGFPIAWKAPARNRFLAKLLFSGKYNTFVVKGELCIAIGPGFPINWALASVFATTADFGMTTPFAGPSSCPGSMVLGIRHMWAARS